MTSSNISTGYGSRKPIFNGDERNYDIWQIKFKSYLRTRGLKDVLTAVPAEVDEDKNADIFAELIQTLDDRSINLIIRDAVDDGRKAMTILDTHYKSKGKPRIITLYTEFTSLTKQSDENVTDYIIRAETLSSSLREAGETISDSLLVAMTMKGLPKEFLPICVVMSQKDELPFMDFKKALRNFEDTEKLTRSEKELSKETIMEARHSYKSKYTSQNNNYKSSRWCTKCKQDSHDTRYCKRFCNIHKNDTHWTRDCQQKYKNTAKSVTANKDEDHSWIFGVSTESFNYTKNFLVDSGATAHIMTSKNNFVHLDENFRPENHVLELANGDQTQGIVQGKGEAIINVKDAVGKSHNIVLKDTLFIPSFKQNIISVTAATSDGATFNFLEDSAHMNLKNHNFIISRQKDLYYLNSVHKPTRSLKDWHEILGHCNKSDILKLPNVVRGMSVSPTDNFSCDTCILAKMTNTKNNEPDTRAKQPLDKVHIDLAGPIYPAARDGFKYALTCVDDYSSISSLYLLKNKSDTPKAFLRFLADIAPYGKIKCVRSDSGGEFTSKEFIIACLRFRVDTNAFSKT